ncbi:uncharacterized protein LOC116005834 [Ipomoea triloba]|uniref:uncharacterized protein LOC116005834 n=1 Tax=Ipomoea triloba TaxID=35885 RepID=UPI00125D6494|nr:uncharacterized protein LOC116005834 [Ipomoea triloba]
MIKLGFIAKCKQSGCPWSITLRWIKDVNCWRVTTFTNTHDGCFWVWEDPTVMASRLAKRWKKDIRGNSKWTLSEFRERVATDDHFHITSKVAYKAMTMARASIDGELEDYFRTFWNYYLEIQRSNPNTTSIVKMSEYVEEGGKKRFLRWYICWEACRNGFQHCRKIIGVDGFHLRSKYGGYLLTATSMDPNDGIFPIAYAMVEGIEVAAESEVTFIFDKKKGLIPAFNVVIPNVVHRFCVRHLYANLKVVGFHAKAIKETLWAAARTTTVNSFKDELRKMKELDINAFEWLENKQPSEWSCSHFTCSALCDILVNNTRGSEWSRPICPNIVKKIAVEEKFAGGYIPLQCDLNLFEVKNCHTGEQHQVGLGKKTCSCRKWDLSGIPFKHAICAIWMKRHNVLDYVNSYYSIENYLKVYRWSIKPMAGPNEWPQTHRETPPEYKAKPGRPKKLRLRGADETKGKIKSQLMGSI